MTLDYKCLHPTQYYLFIQVTGFCSESQRTLWPEGILGKRDPKKCLVFLHFLVFCDKKKRSQGCFPNCVKRRIVGNTQWNLIHIFAASLSSLTWLLCWGLLCHFATLLVTPDVTFTSQLGTTDRFPLATFSNFSALDKTQNSLFWNPNMDSSYISNTR